MLLTHSGYHYGHLVLSIATQKMNFHHVAASLLHLWIWSYSKQVAVSGQLKFWTRRSVVLLELTWFHWSQPSCKLLSLENSQLCWKLRKDSLPCMRLLNSLALKLIRDYASSRWQCVVFWTYSLPMPHRGEHWVMAERPLVLCEPSSSSTPHFWYLLTPWDVKDSAIREVKDPNAKAAKVC